MRLQQRASRVHRSDGPAKLGQVLAPSPPKRSTVGVIQIPQHPVEQVLYETYAHLMPDADDGGRKAMNAFFMAREGSCPPNVPSDVPR